MSTVKLAVSTLVGVFVGTLWSVQHKKASTFVGMCVDIFVDALLRCADFRNSQSRKRYRNDTRSGIANTAAWEWGSKIGRVQKAFWTQGAKVSQEQTHFELVQETFRSMGPNDLLHPVLSAFGHFPFSIPSPKRLGLQFWYA